MGSVSSSARLPPSRVTASPCPPAPSAVVLVLRKALWRRLQTRLLGADGPPEAGLHAEILAQLVPFARAKDLGVLKDRLPSSLQTPDGHQRCEGWGAASGAREPGDPRCWCRSGKPFPDEPSSRPAGGL